MKEEKRKEIEFLLFLMSEWIEWFWLLARSNEKKIIFFSLAAVGWL